MGGVTIVTNIPGIESGKLKLDGATAANIFRGAITKWNDPAIAKLNPGVALPDLAITVSHRSDGSGTTFAFTNYLAKQSMAFMREVGAGNTVNWPANAVGGKGNRASRPTCRRSRRDRLCGYRRRDEEQDELRCAEEPCRQLHRAEPAAVPMRQPAPISRSRAWRRICWTSRTERLPITSATYMLAYEKGADAAKQKGVVDFFTWSLNNGEKMAADLGLWRWPPMS